jgi:hypothetical protein
VKTEFENAARSFQTDIESKAADVEREMRNTSLEIERSVSENSQQGATATPEAPDASSPQLELGIEEPQPQSPPRDAPAP